MGVTERRERERNEMRDRILTAAMQLFTEEGFEQTTMRRIAAAIEYTPGTLYGYFKDKDEILYALHERGFEDLVDQLGAVFQTTSDPKARLHALGRAYMNFALDNPRQYDLMFLARGTGKKIVENEDWSPGTEAYGLLRTAVADYLKDVDSHLDPDLTAFSCWSMVHGLVSLVVANRCIVVEEADRPQLVHATYDEYFRMLTQRATTPPLLGAR